MATRKITGKHEVDGTLRDCTADPPSRCPVRGTDGERVPHYASTEDYERHLANGDLFSPAITSDDAYTASAPGFTLSQVYSFGDITEDYSGEIVPGRIVNTADSGNSDYEERLTEVKFNAEDLIMALSDENGYDLPDSMDSTWHRDENGYDFEVFHEKDLGNGFVLIGSGAERNVYHHRPSGMVYKVYNFDGVGDNWDEDSSQLTVDCMLIDQRAYAAIPDEDLARKGWRYAETMFLDAPDADGRMVPVMVQPYMDYSEYEAVRFSIEEKRDISREFPMLDDMSTGNVWRHRESGEIVFFDCLTGAHEDPI